LQQVWVPKPANAVAAIAIFAVAAEVVSLAFSVLDNPLGEAGEKAGEKTKGLIPDSIKDWLEENVASRREIEAVEKTDFSLMPTKPEDLAYITSIIVLALSFSYVKVSALSQIWELLPVFFATSVLVGFAQNFISILFLRSRGVWSEHKIWPFGLVLYLVSTFAFKVPFSSPTRSVHQSKKFTKRLGALASASEILVGLAFAGLFFLLVREGYPAVGGAGLAMCVLGSFSSTFPVAPLSGRDIFDYSKPLWAAFFIATVCIFGAWLLLM
jgi:predicted membrane protein